MSYTWPSQLDPLAVTGRIIASSVAMQLINGMTSTGLATIMNATSSPSAVLLSHDGTTNGYKLEPGTAVVAQIARQTNGMFVTANGTTAEISWLAS